MIRRFATVTLVAVLAASSNVTSAPRASAQVTLPRCWIVQFQNCLDCPGEIAFVCRTKTSGYLESCVQISPTPECTMSGGGPGYCDQADPGPTGCDPQN